MKYLISQNEYILIRITKMKSQQRLDISQSGLILVTERNKFTWKEFLVFQKCIYFELLWTKI